MRVASPSGGFDLVPANRELAGAEVELVDLPERETRLKDALAEALSQMRTAITRSPRDYDFILLDCPPSLSLLTLNGLCAADCGADSDAVRVLRARRACPISCRRSRRCARI